MTVIFTSPAEPASVKDLLARTLTPTPHEMMVHARPESMGVDFLWRSRGSFYGVQRKELSDLLASMQDGRLAKELGQMQSGVAQGYVLVEKLPRWTLDGELVDTNWSGRPFTFKAWCGLIASICSIPNVTVYQTADIRQTCTTILHLVDYTAKTSHNTATSRPGATGKWGTASSRDWGLHLLQGFPGIGPEVAGAIYDTFGGVPFTWGVTEADLLRVPGVGKTRAKKLIAALESGGARVPSSGDSAGIAS